MADLRTDIAAFEKDAELRPILETKTAEANLGYQAKIVVGGSDPLKFIPNVNASFERKIGDEFFININAKSVLVTDEIPVISKEPEITVGDRTDKFYVTPNGTLEHEIVAAKKLQSNVIELEIQCSPSLVFWHQPALTQAEIDEQDAHRPDNAINGYSVRCPFQNNEYKAGQLAFIYRSWVIDKNGKKSWCEQTVTVERGIGLWQIAIPDKIYNDESLYPLTVGPDVGYTTTAGASSASYAGIDCTKGTTTGTGGEIDDAYIYAHGGGGSINCKLGIYDATAANGWPGGYMGVTAEFQVTEAAPEWQGTAVVGAVEVDASTDYWLGWNSAVNITYYYQAAAANTTRYNAEAYDNFPDPFASTGGLARAICQYFTYTEAAAGESITFTKTALALTGKTLLAEEQYILTKKALALTGKDVIDALVLNLTKTALTLTPKALAANEQFIFTKKALALTGKSLFTAEIFVFVKKALVLTGKTLFMAEIYNFTKKALALTGKIFFAELPDVTITFTKTALTLTGKVLHTAEIFNFVTGTLIFGGKALGATVATAVRKAGKMVFGTGTTMD